MGREWGIVVTKLSWTEQDMLLSNKGELEERRRRREEGRVGGGLQVWRGKRAGRWASRGAGGGTGHGAGNGVVKVSGLRLKILALHFDVWYCVNPP